MTNPVLLITGAALRLGAATVCTFHQAGFDIALHYRSSHAAADELATELNLQRANSCHTIQADLDDLSAINLLAKTVEQKFDRLDVLINNASSFYPTPVGTVTEENWNDLISSNMKAPFFLAQACAPMLTKQQGCIINIVDIHSERALKEHPVYCMAKAGLNMMTKSLATELAPAVRVNGISPGAILWPGKNNSPALDQEAQQNIMNKVPLNRTGEPNDIANTALFLATKAPYISGQIIAVDGGRSAKS